MIQMRIVSKSGRTPEYATEGSAGFDISAFLPEGPMILKAGERALVPTGLYFEVPCGFEAQVRARSGLAIKHGIGLVNGIGTVDSDYRGEIRVPVINWGSEDFTIHDGDRIAQVVITSYEKVTLKKVDILTETDRGEGGFGHTGL